MAKSKETKKNGSSPLWMLDRKYAIICICAFAFLVRLLVSMHSYSGKGKPPMFGDYEAQRHWMEITVHTPITEWYRNTSNNDLKYWGLDYPPLTAYQSYLHGLALHRLHPPSVALRSSRGYESPFSKLLMRWTVLSSDALVFFPAALWFVAVFKYGQKDEDLTWELSMILLQPCLIIIDHGHFQYNCISLGLTLGAVAAILSKRDLIACILFSLALNHKQMSAYYAPAFFSHLLGKCLHRKYPIMEVAKLGFFVIGTFTVIWWPFLGSVKSMMEVVARLAPVERGIFEDYVANFWCGTHSFIKWKQLFSTRMLSWFALVTTVSACVPSMVQQLFSPSNKGFLYSLLNSSLAFYLFSFQVHEKSVLLPLLPASLLALEEPILLKWLVVNSMLSMYPLLRRDELTICYVALLLLFILLFHAPVRRKDIGTTKNIATMFPRLWTILIVAYSAIIFILHFMYVAMQPPKRYPFLFDAAITAFAFLQFLAFATFSNLKQWKLSFANKRDSFIKEKRN